MLNASNTVTRSESTEFVLGASLLTAESSTVESDIPSLQTQQQSSSSPEKISQKRANNTASKSPFKSSGMSPHPKSSKNNDGSGTASTAKRTVSMEVDDDNDDSSLALDTANASESILPNSKSSTLQQEHQQPQGVVSVQNPYLNSTFPTSTQQPPLQMAENQEGEEEEEQQQDANISTPPPPRPTPEQMIENVIKRLRSKKLDGGYASILIDQDSFKKWLLIAKESAELWPWFESFLKDTLDAEVSRKFDEACRSIMDVILSFLINSLQNRKNNKADSFEYQLWHFFLSEKLRNLCSMILPTTSMKEIKPGYTILADMLGELCRKWLLVALESERKRRDPQLFARRISPHLGEDELKSEVNRLVAWAIRSVRDKQTDKTSSKHQLLASMVSLEKDVDDVYLEDRCDLGFKLRNYGGDGGLTLVKEEYFTWAMNVTQAAAKELTVESIGLNGETEIKRATKAMLNNTRLKGDFILAYSRQHKDSQPDIKLATECYNEIITKVCNGRFGEMLKNYNEKMALTGQGKNTLRGYLSTLNGRGDKTSSTSAAATASTSTSSTTAAAANNGSTALVVASPAASATSPITNLSLGMNGVVSYKILEGKHFLIVGAFAEVNSDMNTAIAMIANMIQKFGGTVGTKMSKKTRKYILLV